MMGIVGPFSSSLLILVLLSITTSLCAASANPSHKNVGYEERIKLLQPEGDDRDEFIDPTVLIVSLVRNKAHILPYFLTLLENLDYPKDRLAIWMRSDHNEDSTPEILRSWAKKVEREEKYHFVSVEIVDGPPFRHSDQNISAVQWTNKRFKHIMNLKGEALKVGKALWVDYVWFLDADALILESKTLRHLVKMKKNVVSPMLLSGGMYSNFWGGMKDYYYVRTEEYKEILDSKKRGCFSVPMVHSAVLFNLRLRNGPNFIRSNESVPDDDIIVFAANVKEKGYEMEICNDVDYGFILSPLEDNSELHYDHEQLKNLRIEIASYWPTALKASPDLAKWVGQEEAASTLGFHKVYLINLKRRSDRTTRMTNVLNILNIHYELIEATDGRNLSAEYLEANGIVQLENYLDPYSKRPMTYGEIGCFLSHYKVWEKIVREKGSALVLEDDIRFEPYFKYQVEKLFEDAARLNLDWDLIYLGRKRSANAEEPFVQGSKLIVHVDYSYWTLGYVITARGAKKLMDAEPLKKILPVDEYLPIMFNKHINDEWSAAFPVRNLKAFSAEPLLMYPTHYTGEPGYISDTEASSQIRSSNCSAKEEL